MVALEKSRYSVLIDLDHTILVDSKGYPTLPTNPMAKNTHVGTTPFMALRALQPPGKIYNGIYLYHHLPHYNLKSFIWVFTWLVYQTHSGNGSDDTKDDKYQPS